MSLWRISLSSLLLAVAVTASGEQAAPSAALLEFLADWQDVDDDTFELLLEHGLRDAGAEAENTDVSE